MGASYKAISWNRQKKIYDWAIAILAVAFLGIFIGATILQNPQATQETMIIRSTGALAFLMLHVILIIGPLARLHRLFLPLLYNRRHLGVTMFCFAATHGVFTTIQFHSLGNVNPVLSLFISNTHYLSLSRFPFEVLGVFALIIFLLMGATSHDFWLNQLGARFWKSLHMMVYVAYALILAHVMIGALQYETSTVLLSIVGAGLMTVCALHVAAARKERHIDRQPATIHSDGFMIVCHISEIKNNRAKIVSAGGERIAVFRYEHQVSAVSNVCKHQHGPLGEGRIIDGCITCPWHGYQYLPHNGSSPPPFHEQVATFDVLVAGNGDVWVNPKPYPPGTPRPPAILEERFVNRLN